MGSPSNFIINENISFLSVGTKMLLTDAMDQLIRTFGPIRTHYAQNMASALRIFSEGMIHILVTELDLGDGSAFRLLQNLGGRNPNDDLYVVLAIDEKSDALMALAAEMEAHHVLVKPFSAGEVKGVFERYKLWKQVPKEPWELLLREAHLSAREKKFREAETNHLEAIKSAPDNPIPVYKAGIYYMQKPDPGMAEKLLKRAIDMKSDYIQAVSALGTLYMNRGDFDKAEIVFKRAQQISPLNPDRLLEMSKLYIGRSIESCNNSLRLDSGSVSARVALGKLLAFQKDYVGAVRELEKVVHKLKDDKAEVQTFIALARKLGGIAK